MLPSSKRAKNAPISLTSLRQDYLVAMATSPNKLENKVHAKHSAETIGTIFTKILHDIVA